MTDAKNFLKQLISVPGLSGYETPVRNLIEQAWRPLVDEIETSRLGSLHALRKGNLPEPRPGILLATHMDAIGLMVSGIVDGFLRVVEVGGVDPRVLPGQFVTVHGRQDLSGLVVQPPPHLLPEGAGEKTVLLEHLLVDVGLLPAEVPGKVRIGDLVSFAQEPFEMGADHLVGHSLDNRALRCGTDCLPGDPAKSPAGVGYLGGSHQPGRRDPGWGGNIRFPNSPNAGGCHRCNLWRQSRQPTQ